MSTKYNQIYKFANKASIIDFVDVILNDNNKGGFQKKVIININNYDEKTKHTHKEKFVSFYWDIEELLLIAKDITDNTFEGNLYNAKQPGSYMKYGGGTISRVLQIQCKNGRYHVTVSWFKGKKTSTGAIMPDTTQKIDSHAVQLNNFEMRKAMNYLMEYVKTKLHTISKDKNEITPKTPVKNEQKPSNYPSHSVPNKTVSEPKKEVPKQETKQDNFDDPFADIEAMIDDMEL